MKDEATVFKLTRVYLEDATLGVLSGPTGIICHTLELAWRGNQPNLSCIPEGLFPLIIGEFPRFGKVVRVMAVPGRSAILFHAANNPHRNSGRLELRGCIAPCMSVVMAGGLCRGVDSRVAVSKFMDQFLAARMNGKVALAIFQAVPGGAQSL